MRMYLRFIVLTFICVTLSTCATFHSVDVGMTTDEAIVLFKKLDKIISDRDAIAYWDILTPHRRSDLLSLIQRQNPPVDISEPSFEEKLRAGAQSPGVYFFFWFEAQSLIEMTTEILKPQNQRSLTITNTG